MQAVSLCPESETERQKRIVDYSSESGKIEAGKVGAIMEYRINTDKLNDTEKELLDLLLSISDDNDFITGSLCMLKNDEERNQVIEFIKSNDDVKSEQVVLLSLYLSKTRGN